MRRAEDERVRCFSTSVKFQNRVGDPSACRLIPLDEKNRKLSGSMRLARRRGAGLRIFDCPCGVWRPSFVRSRREAQSRRPGAGAASTPRVVRVMHSSSHASVAVTVADLGPSSTRATSPKKSPAERASRARLLLAALHRHADVPAQDDIHAKSDVAGIDDAVTRRISFDGALLEQGMSSSSSRSANTVNFARSLSLLGSLRGSFSIEH